MFVVLSHYFFFTGISASNKHFPVLWFTSEIFLGAFEDVCGGNEEEMCQRVFRGAMCVTPNFGPGTPSYNKIADAWHAQKSKVGTATDSSGNIDRTSANGCDTTKDILGNGVFLVDHDVDSSTPDVCAAVDFEDYVVTDANAHIAESGGDGRISMYVPFAYDATIMIAHGLHALFTSKAFTAATTEAERLELMDGTNIFKHMLRSTFSGFSGTVNFRCSDTTTCADVPFADMEIGKTYVRWYYFMLKNNVFYIFIISNVLLAEL